MPADIKKDKVLVITGPTASGKTSLSIDLAKELNGEIISGDSIQIYRGLDIGSAKIAKEEMNGVKHHLLDIKDPKETYSVKEFQELGRACIADIVARGKLPIVVGGTGLYIKALLYDYKFFDETQPDEQFEDKSNEELYAWLAELDSAALEKIHVNNRKRIVRALNIYLKHQKGISEIKEEQEHVPLYDVLFIGKDVEREVLNQRINQRVDLMVNNGLLKEINDLLANGVTFEDQCMQGIGYREFKALCESSATLEECVEEVKKNTRKFAKRQMTWFHNQFPVYWCKSDTEAKEAVYKWVI